jgi:hypothetical protein
MTTRGGALAQLIPVLEDMDSRFICKRSFIINARYILMQGTYSYLVCIERIF